jgi:Family of unknown function (DUF5683)
MTVFKKIFPALTIALAANSIFAQKTVTVDSMKTVVTTTDTTKNGVVKKIKVYDPKKAVIRSAIFPGLGQIYNKKYWKLPIVYGAMGISAGVFFYNFKSYKDTRFAYQAKYKASKANATAADSVDYFKIKPPLARYSLETLKYYRDSYRRDIDYSVLVFILLWGLNVVDAAVDAHLKAFDVSPDLSLKIKPGHSQMAGTNGVSIVLSMR